MGEPLTEQQRRIIDRCARGVASAQEGGELGWIVRGLVERLEQAEAERKLGRALIDHLQGQLTWERTEHDKARDEWLNMRDHLNGLHRAVTRALEHTRPPDSWVGNSADYDGEAEAEPYGWLATLVAEALADHPPALNYDDAATEALPTGGNDAELAIHQRADRLADRKALSRDGADVADPPASPAEGSEALNTGEPQGSPPKEVSG